MRNDKSKEIERVKKSWEEEILKPALKKLNVEESPNKYYSPLDLKDFNFLEKVGFPGDYPFTSNIYPSIPPGITPRRGGGYIGSGKGLVRAGSYAGYGTPEDTRDYYSRMASLGSKAGPNLAFDLPTQLGYDSDDPRAFGEVGMTGVAIDTLRDFEIIYEAFKGDMEIDKIASNWTINAPAIIIIAMYAALAEKRGIPLNKLRGTPQNDILKEYIARGNYIFPIKNGLRLTRDTFAYCTQNIPKLNIISICGYHMREAGATAEQVLAFVLSNSSEYIKLGLEAGLDIDVLSHHFTWLSFGGSMNFFNEIALSRAARRMWAKIMRERFKAKDKRSCILRSLMWAQSGEICTTRQRPLNNLCRSILGGIASVLSGGAAEGGMGFPFDEPLGLGHSLEGWQLHLDAARIIGHETKINEVMDPLAGSYYVENLTDKIEKGAWEIMERIEKMGGMKIAIENGFPQREIARSAHEFQKDVESGKRKIVGVNCFTDENEIEVLPQRTAGHPYDPEKRVTAEIRQIADLDKVKKERDNETVEGCLKRLEEAAEDDAVNLVLPVKEAVEAYASVGEICSTLRNVFGTYKAPGIF
jgi:methylmalonyl-CoA mutase N-terminal domain/subunit